MDSEFDLVIIGGGLVGSSLAAALDNLPLRILLVDAKPLLLEAKPQHDSRTVVLSYSSCTILKTLGLWPEIAPHATHIQQIHVSNRGHFGFTRMQANKFGVDSLGAVIPLQRIQIALNKKLQNQKNITLLPASSVNDYNSHTLDINNQSYTAKLIIAADGTNSTMRELVNIDVIKKDYQQHAIVANVDFAKPNKDFIAYERFVDDHLLALLPISQQTSSLVFTCDAEQTPHFKNQSDTEFLKHLQLEFGYRLGRFTQITPRMSFPLQLVYTTEQYKHGVLLLGNAAHTLHPIAGQGFNLGLRDCASLAEVIAQAIRANNSLNDPSIIYNYLSWRKQDQARCIRFTDRTLQLFSNEWLPTRLARNLGLVTLDMFPSMKQRFARRAMGYYGRAAKLATGNPIT